MFTCIENNLAKFPNGKLPRSFNGFLSKIRDEAETRKYWKLKKQRPNRRFLSRSIDYCVAKAVKLDLRTSGTCLHRHEVAYFQFCRAKGGNIINNKRIKNSVATLWSNILHIVLRRVSRAAWVRGVYARPRLEKLTKITVVNCSHFMISELPIFDFEKNY